MKSMGSGWENLKIQLALKGLSPMIEGQETGPYPRRHKGLTYFKTLSVGSNKHMLFYFKINTVFALDFNKTDF